MTPREEWQQQLNEASAAWRARHPQGEKETRVEYRCRLEVFRVAWQADRPRPEPTAEEQDRGERLQRMHGAIARRFGLGQTMTLEEVRDRVAIALVRAAREHGVPNTFSPHELEMYYTRISRMLVGRVGKYHLAWINDRLRAHGYQATYVGRVFAVTEAEA